MRLGPLLIALPGLLAAPVSYYVLPAWLGETSYGYWIIDVSASVVVPLLCLFILDRKGVHPKDYGLALSLSGYKIPEFAAISFLCTLAYLGYVLVSAVARVHLSEPAGGLNLRLHGESSFAWLAVVYYATTGAFFEETFFRGILGTVFLVERSRLNASAFVCVSAVLFAFAHAGSSPSAIVSYLYVGLVSALIYIRLRNLWPLVIAHFVADLVVLAWWLSKTGT
jgi:membrane protease YdiL (CAAX protease family)